jgi:hypothetical protein
VSLATRYCTWGCVVVGSDVSQVRVESRNEVGVGWSSQVKLLITNNAFCIVQRATAQSITGFFRDYGVAEAPPGFQSGWFDCMYFFVPLFLFILIAHLEFSCKFLYS